MRADRAAEDRVVCDRRRTVAGQGPVNGDDDPCAEVTGARSVRWPRMCLIALASALGWVVLWAHVHVALMPYLLDDSYIHFRVADHLARYGVPYFNLGEVVKTSSSSCWTVVLAGLFSLWPRNIQAVLIACALISTAGLVSFVALVHAVAGRRLAVWETVMTGTVYVALVQVASVAAMETPLAILFATMGMHAYLRQRPWAFACLALAAATRLELVPLVLLMALAVLLTHSLPVFRSLIWGLAAGVPFVIYDLINFGTVVPHAMVVKPLIHHIMLRQALGQVVPEAVTYMTHGSVLVVCVVVLGYFILATLPIAAIRWSHATLLDPRTHVLLASAVSGLIIAAAYVSAHSIVFAWYRPLCFALLFLPALAGAARGRSKLAYVAIFVAAAPMLFDLMGTCIAAAGRPEAYRYFLDGARSKRTLEIAEQLYRDYPNADLMTAEIGATGFGFRGKIEDGAAIASPAALAYYPLAVPSERHSLIEAPVPRMFVRDKRPGIVVSVDTLLSAVWRDPIRSEYVHIRRSLYCPEDDARRQRDELLWWSARYLDVLVRRDLWESRHHDEQTRPH